MLCSDHAWKIPKITEIYFSLINYCGHLRAEKVCSCFWLRVKWGQKAVGLDHDLSGPVAVVNLQSWADLVKTDQAVPAKRSRQSVVHSASCWKQKMSQHYIRYCTKRETGAAIYSLTSSPATKKVLLLCLWKEACGCSYHSDLLRPSSSKQGTQNSEGSRM